jgi:hypothetical protein
MNLKMYYDKIREWEARIGEEFVVLASLETPDGGRIGVKTEAGKRTAARMIVEGRARLATPAEAEEFRQEQAAAKAESERAAAAARVQVAVVSGPELEKLKGGSKAKA